MRLFVTLQLELLLRKLLRILDVSCAHENENAVLCFFNTSVVVSVINSAPSIRFCRSSIVNSPLFSRADPKISHKYTWSALLRLSANSSKNFSVRENVCGWNTATISRSGCFDELLQSLH